LLCYPPVSLAQIGGIGGGGGIGGVGGVWIDADGMLHAATGGKGKPKITEPVLSEEIARPSELREISLKSIGEEIASLLAAGEPIPAELEQAAGLARIDFIIFDRDRNDVRLAGPAEGWKISSDGRAIGKTTHRSIIKLEDLATAIRCVWGGARQLSCSIDPTKEGLAEIQRIAQTRATESNASKLREIYREALGDQVVTTGGVPAGSRYARVMVEADYLMKQMGVGTIKIRDITSHIESQSKRNKEGDYGLTLARWWFTSQYEPLDVNRSRTVFGIRGPRLRLLSEEMMLAKTGERRGSGRASRDQFADEFTEHIEELQASYPAFSDLANLYDLALVAALMDREGWADDWANTIWADEKRWPTPTGAVTQKAEAVAVCETRKGKDAEGQRSLLISVAYGGVSIRPADLIAELPAGGPPVGLPLPSKPPSPQTMAKLEPIPEPKTEKKWWKDVEVESENTPSLRPKTNSR
jgi:hypothetical protein